LTPCTTAAAFNGHSTVDLSYDRFTLETGYSYSTDCGPAANDRMGSNLGIDSKHRECDLVALKVRDVSHGHQLATRAIVMQHKTKRPVQFEITAVTREALQAWIKQAALKSDDFLFPSRLHDSPHLGTRQYARILGHWVDELGLDRSEYGTHSMRRTKATLIYRRTKNLRAVQLLLGHSKLELTVPLDQFSGSTCRSILTPSA
jgi:site-specific recombinase XerC